MKIDLHTHHERCGHAYGEIEDYIRSAIDKGFQMIGITDHCPDFGHALDQPVPRLKMAKSHFPEYVEEVLALKEKYANQIEVLLGVESDYIPGKTDLYAAEYAKYPMDYVIGSVHGIGEVSIFAQGEWEQLDQQGRERVKRTYYELIQGAVKCGEYQIIGHLDALKTRFPQYSETAPEIVDETLRIIGEHDGVIEVNTSGDRKGLTEWFPSPEVLERAHYYNVQVTFGSDAHRPEHVGAHWDEVCRSLREIGYRHWIIFRNKKPYPIEIQNNL